MALKQMVREYLRREQPEGFRERLENLEAMLDWLEERRVLAVSSDPSPLEESLKNKLDLIGYKLRIGMQWSYYMCADLDRLIAILFDKEIQPTIISNWKEGIREVWTKGPPYIADGYSEEEESDYSEEYS